MYWTRVFPSHLYLTNVQCWNRLRAWSLNSRCGGILVQNKYQNHLLYVCTTHCTAPFTKNVSHKMWLSRIQTIFVLSFSKPMCIVYVLKNKGFIYFVGVVELKKIYLNNYFIECSAFPIIVCSKILCSPNSNPNPKLGFRYCCYVEISVDVGWSTVEYWGWVLGGFIRVR